MGFSKILVALDRSPQESSVLQTAIDQAQSASANLLLVHCIRPEDVQSGPFLGIGTLADLDTYGTLRRLQHEQIQKELERAQPWLQVACEDLNRQDLTADWTCLVGEPSVELCRLAQSWGADLIVMGRRGHQGFTEIVLGSVSNYVVHHAPCSVLVVQGLPIQPSASPVSPSTPTTP